jgi:glutathione S-transferase
VPVITYPGGFILHESRPICEYLARKHSLPLLPLSSDHEATALFQQAQSVETQYFAQPAGQITFEKFVKKFMGLPANESVVSEALKSVEDFFDVAERLLERDDYMAGDKFTLVDIYYIPLIQRLFVCGYEDIVGKRKAVSNWWARCVERPAIQKMFAADREEAAALRA